jgi:hypothetical protein
LTWNITKKEFIDNYKNDCEQYNEQDNDSYESGDVFTIIFRVVDSDGAETVGKVNINGLIGEKLAE